MEQVIVVTVHKNGNSLAVVLPHDICRVFGIRRGDQMFVSGKEPSDVLFRKMDDSIVWKTIRA